MKPTRTLDDRKKYPRTEPEIPNEVTSEVLCNHKLKNSASFRRTMMSARTVTVEFPRTTPKTFQVLVAEFARTRNARQLRNHITRYGRTLKLLPPRLAQAESALAALPTSLDLQAVVANLRLIIHDARHHYDACLAEFKRRTEPKPETV